MSQAPADFSAGISVLTPFFGTTVSSARMSCAARVITVGDAIAGRTSSTASS